MEVMYSCNPNNGYFVNNSFIGFCGEVKDLSILVDNLLVCDFNIKYKVKRYVRFDSDLFNILDLDKDFLNKRINDLSYCELKLFKLLFILKYNPSLIVFNYFDVGFNSKYKSKISKIMKFLNASLGINFIVISNDCLFMNKCCKHVIVCCDKIIKFQGSVSDVILEGYMDKPAIYDFIDKANECGADLSYTLDNKELLKDIYRSVF